MKLSQKNLLLLRQGQNLNRNGLKRPKEESKGHPRPAKSAIPKTLPQNGQMNLLPPMNDKLPPPLVLQHTAVFPHYRIWNNKHNVPEEGGRIFSGIECAERIP
jgi:hypothetical protein